MLAEGCNSAQGQPLPGTLSEALDQNESRARPDVRVQIKKEQQQQTHRVAPTLFLYGRGAHHLMNGLPATILGCSDYPLVFV